MIKIGLCGFTMAVEDYFRYFPLVEVQQTFYQPPRMETLERWRAEAPPEFEFTMKAWQLITHQSSSKTYRRLRRSLSETEKRDVGAFQWTPIVQEAWRVTVACARTLQATAILFQCPASFRPTEDNVARMRTFFSNIERPPDARLMWEPRGPWPADLVGGFCREFALIHVVDPFVNAAVTGPPIYYRLHGITGARHKYTDAELKTLAGMVPSTGESYVMFNNMPRVDDALRFKKLVTAL